MSIRIHALAKELSVTSKELMDFINSRRDKYGLEIKTPSNAIASLYVDAISSDFKAARAAEASKPETSDIGAAKDADRKIVKSAEEVADEKREALERASDGPSLSGREASSAGQLKDDGKSGVGESEASPKTAESVSPDSSSPAKPAESAAKKPAVLVPPHVSKAAPRAAPLPLGASPKQQPSPANKPEVLAFAADVKKPAPAVPPSALKKTAPAVPPPLAVPRAKMAMPPVAPSEKSRSDQERQPEVVVRMEPKQPARPAPAIPPVARKAPTFVPPVSNRRSAPAVPPIPNAPASEHRPAPVSNGESKKTIVVKPPIIVRDFAKSIDLKPFRLISELMDMGIFASMNQSIDENIAVRIAERHGYALDIRHRGEQQNPQITAAQKRAMAKKIDDDIKNYVPRPPIVCVLGHVDHGKTTLLDSIRKTRVAAGEAGGITQHTAAYQVDCGGKKITFLDTPGHAAFSKMRERGANVTDIAILVVAADDGFMPQTDEALAFAQKAGVPIVVAINKMDAKGANIDRVKQQMQKRGITSEDWGGEVLCTPVSALKGENIDKLLELVLLQAEIMELKANPKTNVEGVVIESQLEPGRGATSTVIVRSGTLKPGDVLVCGEHWCKVRALLDERGAKMKSAEPSAPAVVMGWTGAPEAGDNFSKVDNDRQAREMTSEAVLERKKAAAAEASVKPMNLEELMAAIENKEHKIYKCIVKSDVSGTVEALVACLEAIKSDKVGIEIISSGVGQITKNDVKMAATSKASIVGFNVKQENGVAGDAKHQGVEIIIHNIIYELINQVREAMKNLLDPEMRENKLGAAEVRALFNVSKGGKVAGCMVTEGIIKRDKFARVFRKGVEISAKGRISDIKRFKDDVSEVRAGYECGVSLSNFTEFEPGDIIECFEILEIRPDL